MDIIALSKKDRIKFTLDFYKSAVLLIASAVFGICGFLVINLESLNILQILGCVFGIVVLIIIFAIVLV